MSTSDNAAHYAQLAATYDQHWSHSDAFVTWMTAGIVDALALRPHHQIIDVGCGTGLYSRRIADAVRPEKPVLCADPSAAMLGHLRATVGLRPVLASAEQLGGARPNSTLADVPLGSFDAVLVKEAIHHVAPS
ncbi:class I SAM-dependent methyltransferase, partial [Frankia sp. KB5]|uniref:class I SAM-dependent methyltransferase n=2 Tax=unclassified Frankia TaxID=2632575 RepID=UPI0010563EEC